MQPTPRYAATAERILTECSQALKRVDDDSVSSLIDAIEHADQVFFVGVGRVMLALQCIAKRLSHIGVNVHVVGEITEPPIRTGDLLIAGSGSGESLVPVVIARKAKALGATVAWIGSNERSTLAGMADLRVRIPVKSKLGLADELDSMQPMTSLFEQSLLLLGDAIAMMLLARKPLGANEYFTHANLE